MPTFPEWEATVLEEGCEAIDYLSLHQYASNRANDLPTFLAVSLGMDQFIETVAATCDYARAKSRAKKPVYLSFDEWNVWYHSVDADKELEAWTVGPHQLEDVYDFEDSLVVGCMMNTLLRHADRVKIACLAQLVNVIAPIMTRTGGPAWRQATYWPFALASKFGRGTSMALKLDCPRYANAEYGDVPYLDASAVLAPDRRALSLFVVNRHPSEAIGIDLRAAGLEGLRFLERYELVSEDTKAINDEAHPDRVSPTRMEGRREKAAEAALSAAPLSWNLYRFALAE